MKPFGQTLKEAREAKGLTASALAKETHLLVQIVEGLEAENFKRIPAPVYGRGFVKLYCEAVGLDPKPMIDAFIALYEGQSAEPEPPAATPAALPAAKAREPEALTTPAVETAVETAVEQPSNPSSDIPPVVRGLALFDRAPETVSPEPPASPFVSSYAPEKRRESTPLESAVERFRRGLSSVSHGVIGTSDRIPRHVWRIAALATGAGLLLLIIVWSCIALYRATDGENDATTRPAAEEKIAATAPAPVVQPAAPAPASGKLHTSGETVPAAYVD